MIMEELEMSTIIIIPVLPEDIIMEILSRFPVETILNSFKFVCKAWHTLIKNPDFVKMHLHRRNPPIINRGGGGGGGRIFNSNNNSNNSLFCKSGDTLYQLYPPFNLEGLPIPPPPIAAKELDFDLASLSSRLVGSCNGLLCMRDFRNDQRKNYIIILNPSTRKYKVLPKQPMVASHKPFKHSTDPDTYGFGCCYNNNNNDYEYKLVRIAYFYPPVGSLFIDPDGATFKFQIDIYSLSSNSWKRRTGIEDFPALISKYRPAIFLNGALHWTGSSICHASGDLRDVLISFDMRDENYRPVAMPPCVILDNKPTADKIRDKILINLRGCLGMICVTTCRSSMCWDFDIWVMKEYGITASWTRECVIRSSDTDPPGALSEFTITWSTKACFLKGDQILINKGYGRMALYDMNSKKIDGDFKMVGVPYKAPIAGRVPVVDLADHIETLVSPKSSQLPSLEQQSIEEEEW